MPERIPFATLADYVQDALERHAEHVFLAEPGGPVLRYGEAARAVEALHGKLRDAGVRPHDRVAVLGGNGAHWCLAYLAVVTYGAVVVPVLTDFAPSGIHNILVLSGSRAAFVEAGMLDTLDRGPIPDLQRVWVLEDFSEVPLEHLGDRLQQLKSTVSQLRGRAQQILEEHIPPLRHPPARPRPEDLAAVVYTSGTTGSSKGVMLTQGNLAAAVQSAVTYVEITPADRMLAMLPLAHTYECTCGFLGPMGGGASIHFLRGKPSPRVLQEAFAETRPTLVFAVPLVIEKIYRKRVVPAVERNVLVRSAARVPAVRRAIYRKAVKGLLKAFGGNLRQMGLGGAALAPEVERFLQEGRFPYHVGYGMTECGPLIAGTRPEDTRAGSCGYATPGIEIRIDGADARTGVGEVQVRGPMVTPGYFHNQEATEAAFTPDGWLRTGDLGVLGGDGYLHLRGRSKNVILGPSGENIYPEEVEQLLAGSPLVLECLVVQREHRLTALILPDSETLATDLGLYGEDEGVAGRRVQAAFAALVEQVNAELPAFGRLSSFVLVEKEFEKTPTAKIKRYLYA